MEHSATRKANANNRHNACDTIKELMILREHEFARYRLNRLERMIAHRILDGETNALIAQHLFMSLSCVKYHVRNIYRKVGCMSKAEFCQAIRSGIDASASQASRSGATRSNP